MEELKQAKKSNECGEKIIITFKAVPKYSSDCIVLGIGLPGWTTAKPRVLTKRSSMTNLDKKPQIRIAFLYPTLCDSDANIVSDSRKTTSTPIVSENG